MTGPYRAASKSRKQTRCFHARAMPTRVAYICGRVCACTRMCVCVQTQSSSLPRWTESPDPRGETAVALGQTPAPARPLRTW